MASYLEQADYPLRLQWGAVGAASASADVCIVIDVLSFSTTVCIAVERGTSVYPFAWNDDRAVEFARRHDATLAVGRLEVAGLPDPRPPSLSPAALLKSDAVRRLVLPSPNGATISALLDQHGTQVAVGCLRNAGAVAHWAADQLQSGRTVALIAAGERWPHEGSLRPALEDHLGAGAIAHRLGELGWAAASPEVRAAAALFGAMSPSLHQSLFDCVSGRELTERGFAADVEAAADLDSTAVVPVLRGGAFTTR